MVRSTLYRLNLSISGGPLYCTEESLYNEVQAVQAELIQVLRGLVLYRRVPVQRGPCCTVELVHVWRALVLYRGVHVQ